MEGNTIRSRFSFKRIEKHSQSSSQNKSSLAAVVRPDINQNRTNSSKIKNFKVIDEITQENSISKPIARKQIEVIDLTGEAHHCVIPKHKQSKVFELSNKSILKLNLNLSEGIRAFNRRKAPEFTSLNRKQIWNGESNFTMDISEPWDLRTAYEKCYKRFYFYKLLQPRDYILLEKCR